MRYLGAHEGTDAPGAAQIEGGCGAVSPYIGAACSKAAASRPPTPDPTGPSHPASAAP